MPFGMTPLSRIWDSVPDEGIWSNIVFFGGTGHRRTILAYERFRMYSGIPSAPGMRIEDSLREFRRNDVDRYDADEQKHQRSVERRELEEPRKRSERQR
jgi:hypothetical protein